ncbi:MAG: NAD(P)-dependent oxidoreductase [Alphaproteobacteria bacterium]|nr:NAD(P)-dependent oxidoreductase [Alphaproteobacteria bacterium]
MENATAVIGMGLMGTAIAARLCTIGRPVVVWNRTPLKCTPLADKGALVAKTARDAIDTADTVILVTTTTNDVTGFFDSKPGQLANKDVVNLITGSPRHIRELGDHVMRAGAAYLSGTIQCYPSNIGSENATILFGGAVDVWQRQEPLLRALAGGATYLGSKVDMPNIVDVGATAGFFFSAMGACLEAVSYASREGLGVGEFRPFVRQALQLLPAQIDMLLDAVEQQDFGTTDATLSTFSKSMDLFRSAFADVDAPDLLLAANHERIQAAVAAGDGEQGFAALCRY